VVVGVLADIQERAQTAGVQPPAIIIIGDVVLLQESLGGWFARSLASDPEESSSNIDPAS
jgi:hypothetical protein